MTAGQRRQALILLLRLLAVLLLCMRDARLTPGPAQAGAGTLAAPQGGAGQPALSAAGEHHLPALEDTAERLQGSADPAEAGGTTGCSDGLEEHHQAAQGSAGAPISPESAAAVGAGQSSDAGADPAAAAAPGSGGQPGGGAAGAAPAGGSQGQAPARAEPAGSSDAAWVATQAPGNSGPSPAAGAEPGAGAAAGTRGDAAGPAAGGAERGEPVAGEVPEAGAQGSAALPAHESPAPVAQAAVGAREEERHNLALAKDGAKVRSC